MKPDLTTTRIGCFHGHTNFFHELTSIIGTYSSDGSMGPASYCLGPTLCSSSDVSRIVGNETRPNDYSNRMFPWTNFFHELTSVVGKKSSKESVGPNNYT